MNGWNIWINLGEEITDGMAIGPNGEVSRIKVPSTGKLPGIIKRQIATDLFEIEQNWGVNDDIFSDYHFSLLDDASQSIKVLTFDAGNSTLRLAVENSRIKAGNKFEIFANEKAEVLVSRILTKTLLKNEFPQLKMQPFITKNVNSLYPLLITSSGFSKHPIMNTQHRDQLFNLNIKKTHSLFDTLLEVDEGMDTMGNVIIELYESKINNLLREVFKFKSGLVVIALGNASKNPLHEKTIFNLLKTAGIKNVFASHMI